MRNFETSRAPPSYQTLSVGRIGKHLTNCKVSGGNFGRGVTTGRCLPFRNELNIQLNFCMITTYKGHTNFLSHSGTTDHFKARATLHVRSYLHVRSSPHLPYLVSTILANLPPMPPKRSIRSVPSKSRRKPFSNKQKKLQLQQKRLRKRERDDGKLYGLHYLTCKCVYPLVCRYAASGSLGGGWRGRDGGGGEQLHGDSVGGSNSVRLQAQPAASPRNRPRPLRPQQV